MYFFLVILAAIGFFIYDSIQTHKAQPWRSAHCHVSNAELDKRVAQFDRIESRWKALVDKSWESEDPSPTDDFIFYHESLSVVHYLEAHKTCFVKPETYGNSEIDLYGGGIGLFQRVEGLALDQVKLSPLDKITVKASDLERELNFLVKCKDLGSSGFDADSLKSYNSDTYRMCSFKDGTMLNVVTADPGTEFDSTDFPPIQQRDKTRSPDVWTSKWYIGVFSNSDQVPTDSQTSHLVWVANLIAAYFDGKVSIQASH